MLDPELKRALGTTALETGDYHWRDDMQTDMMATITKRCNKWVIEEPPAGYDISNPADIILWRTRRTCGLHWVRADAGQAFAKLVYQTYVKLFDSAIKGHGSSTFVSCLENFYRERWKVERGELTLQLRASLAPLCELCKCSVENLVSRFSFVKGHVMRGVYDFFGQQVRRKPNLRTDKKEHEPQHHWVPLLSFLRIVYSLQLLLPESF